MRCERCLADTRVEPHEIDDFTGHLCAACREAWRRFQERGSTRW